MEHSPSWETQSTLSYSRKFPFLWNPVTEIWRACLVVEVLWVDGWYSGRHGGPLMGSWRPYCTSFSRFYTRWLAVESWRTYSWAVAGFWTNDKCMVDLMDGRWRFCLRLVNWLMWRMLIAYWTGGECLHGLWGHINVVRTGENSGSFVDIWMSGGQLKVLQSSQE